MQLPGSNKEAKEKLLRVINKNKHEVMSEACNACGSDEEKIAKLYNLYYVRIERTSKLFASLESTQ